MKPLFWICALVLIVLVSACKKEDLPDVVEDDSLECIDEFDAALHEIDADIEEFLEQQFQTEDVANRSCPNRTLLSENQDFPRTIKIDYGVACTRHNGRVFSGKIIVQLDAPRTLETFTRTLEFIDFKINSTSVEGQSKRTKVSNGIFSHEFNIQYLFPDGETAQWSGFRSVVQIEGQETPRYIDDVFEITGNSTGHNKDGVTFISEITTPLIRHANCPWPSFGVRKITRGEQELLMDYEPGVARCNNLVEVTYPDGTSKTIRVRNRFN